MIKDFYPNKALHALRGQRVWLIGGNGYIAKRIIEYSDALNIELIVTSRDHRLGSVVLDLMDTPSFDFKQIKHGDFILHAAAISSPDLCSDPASDAFEVNVNGASKFLQGAIARGARVIFFSSDTVYGDQPGCLQETAECYPVGRYAEMKASIEALFLGLKNFKSIRLSYVYSDNDKFTKYLADCAANNTDAMVFDALSRSVIHREDVVFGILNLMSKWGQTSESVINFGGPECLSRLDLAKAYSAALLTQLKIKESEPPEGFFDNRPRVINLQSDILKSLLERSPLSVTKALEVHQINLLEVR